MRTIVLTCAILLLTACTYERYVAPIHPTDLPPCRGTWICDSRAGKTCICLTAEQLRRWKQRNGV